MNGLHPDHDRRAAGSDEDLEVARVTQVLVPAGVAGAPRLSVELVPSSCWLSNVRSLMRRYQWQKLSKVVCDEAGRRCEICGGTGRQHPVECHEVWFYDDAAKVQRLMRLIALCPMCHLVKHFGRAQLENRGEQAFAWLRRVNEWRPEQAGRYLEAVQAQHVERSRWQWTLDLEALEGYEVTPEMLVIDGEPMGGYVLAAARREMMQHGRRVDLADL